MKKFGEESYTIYATIRAENFILKKVKCKIYLPMKESDSISLKFELTLKQSKKMEEIRLFSLHSKLVELNGYIREIKAENIIWNSMRSSAFAPKSYEISMTANPELVSINTLRPDVLEQENIYTEYWLTENPLFIYIGGSISYYPSGKVTVHNVGTMRFTLEREFNLTIKEHYKYYSNDSKETISFVEVIATCKLKGKSPLITPKQKLSLLNDFLLIVSFGSRRRCSCVGWLAGNDRQITEIYRQRYNSRTFACEILFNS